MVQQRTDARPRAIQPMPGPASHTAATSVFDSSGTWNGEIAKNRSSDDGEAFVPESARPMNPSLIARQQAAERRQAAASNVDSTAQDLSSAVERAKPGAPSKLKTPDQLI